jgi:hypothetical protein
METVETLTDLKDQIESSKQKKAQAEGRLEGHMETLKNEHDVSTTKQAETKMAKLDKESDILEEDIKKGMKEIEGMMEQNHDG